MWVQFTSPCSLDWWIHCFFINPHSLQPINSFKIQWSHLAYKDTFCCSESSECFCNCSKKFKKILNIINKFICKGNKWSKWNKTHERISSDSVSEDYRILVYYTLKKGLYKFCFYEIYDSIWTWNMVHKFIGEIFWKHKNLLRFI
jgi:hypothetical protein